MPSIGPIPSMTTSTDPYTQQLTQLAAAIRGAQIPGGGSATTQTQTMAPGQEAAAYQTAFGSLGTPGAVPESQLSGYFNLAQPYLFGTGMENINQTLAAAGFGPGGSSAGQGAAPVGPQAELAARLQSQIGVQEANILAQNASQGAQTAARIGQTRYSTLTRPTTTSITGKIPAYGTDVNAPASWSGAGSSGGRSTAGGSAASNPDWWTGAPYAGAYSASAGWNAAQPGGIGSNLTTGFNQLVGEQPGNYGYYTTNQGQTVAVPGAYSTLGGS